MVTDHARLTIGAAAQIYTDVLQGNEKMKLAMTIWLIIGTVILIGWIVGDLRNSLVGHKSSVGFAIFHCFSRLPMVLIVFGLLWPLGIGMVIYGHRHITRKNGS